MSDFVISFTWKRLTRVRYDWEHLLSSYRRYVDRNSAVLEVGSSTVERTMELSRYCRSLIGVELFPHRIPRDFNNVTYVQGDWQSLSSVIPPESIDLLVSSNVIEHVPADLKAINETYKVLKSGGVALMNTPNRKRLVRALIEAVSDKRNFPWWEHVREYTLEDLTTLLKSSLFRSYKIIPVAFGVHARPAYLYVKRAPTLLTRLACFYEIHLFKG